MWKFKQSGLDRLKGRIGHSDYLPSTPYVLLKRRLHPSPVSVSVMN